MGRRLKEFDSTFWTKLGEGLGMAVGWAIVLGIFLWLAK